MLQRILGIDIGSYSIKVAEIERSFRSFELVGFYEQPILHSPHSQAQEKTDPALKEGETRPPVMAAESVDYRKACGVLERVREIASAPAGPRNDAGR